MSEDPEVYADQTLQMFSGYLRDYRIRWPHQRLGQSFFNALSEFDADVADVLRESASDPFYDDVLIEHAWAMVHRLLIIQGKVTQ
jgi:hypothetical protein